jgi:hypothetical protein
MVALVPIEPGAMYRRGTPAAVIEVCSFSQPLEGNREAILLSFVACIGTHTDLVYPERRVEPNGMIGSGRNLDTRGEAAMTVEVPPIDGPADVEAGEFVFLRTGQSAPPGTPEYYRHSHLSWEVVDLLVSTSVNAVGIDAQGLGRGHSEYYTRWPRAISRRSRTSLAWAPYRRADSGSTASRSRSRRLTRHQPGSWSRSRPSDGCGRLCLDDAGPSLYGYGTAVPDRQASHGGRAWPSGTRHEIEGW